ncbi:MAG: hypothetical protein FJ405_09520 [Verrucomicrobia bacterium]|nr:hypothetical protein [Verrucomicrobiota bacterium]
MKRSGWLVSVVLLVGAVWLIAPLEKRAARSFPTIPLVYGQTDVTRYLRKRGIEVEVVKDVRRDASGAALYISLFDNPSDSFSLIKIATNGLTRMMAPGHRAFLGSNDVFVAWYGETGRVVHFQNGQILELPRFALFDVDPGGTYFVIGDKPGRLGRVQFPQKKVMIANDVMLDSVFVSQDRIYVTGISYVHSSSGRTKSLATCLILKDEGDDFRILERLDVLHQLKTPV